MRIVLLLSALTGIFCGCATQTVLHPSKLTYPDLDWQVPLGEPYRTNLANGLRLYIAEDHTLPLVNLCAYFRTGSLMDPEGKEGLGYLTARLMQSGGTEAIPADTLDERLERFAISLSVTMSETQLEVKASFLSDFTDTALAMLEQILFHPAFQEDRTQREKKILLQGLQHRFDEPGPTVAAAYDKALYPAQSNSRMATEGSVQSISRRDIAAFHHASVNTGNTIMAIAGDFDKTVMAQRLERMFPPSNARDTAAFAFPKVEIAPRARCLVVHMPITQAYVRMGLPFVKRPHPDYYPMLVLNTILGGGGFTSRLGTTVRSDLGLTYSIYSSTGNNYVFPDPVTIAFFTKTETANRAIELTVAEVKKIVEGGVTEEELDGARKMLIDGLPSMFRSKFDIVENYAWSEYAGRAPDHFAVYPSRIEAMTQDSLARVGRKYLSPERLTYVVVGDTSRLFADDTGSTFSLGALSPRVAITPDMIPGLYLNEVNTQPSGH